MITNLSKLSFLIILSLSIFMVGCDDDDKKMDPTATISVDDQVISQNMVLVSSADLPQDGFVVIHRDNGSGAPVVPAIISEPVAIKAGMENDILVPILDSESLSDGETLWIMLHTDTGQKGVYEFDGSTDGADGPFTTDDGSIVMSPIEVSSASITVSNQPVNNNVIVIDEVVAARDGFLVVHNDDGTGNIVLPGIIGKTQVTKGVNKNVSVTLDGTNTYTAGQKLFPMLHLDNGIIGQYEFDGSNGFDGPEIFSNDAFPGNVIFTSFEVQ